MRILALDATAAACSAAVWVEGRVVAVRRHAGERGHAAHLVPLAVEALAEAAVTTGDLDAVAAGVGPGSFTGIRIALAAAVGFAAAHGLRTAGITSFAALAQAADPEAGETVLAALDTKRSEVYAAALDAGGVPVPDWPAGPSGTGLAAKPAEVATLAAGLAGPILLAGDVQDELARLLAPLKPDMRRSASVVPDAAAVARLAATALAAGEAPPLRPLYLRAPDAVPARR